MPPILAQPHHPLVQSLSDKLLSARSLCSPLHPGRFPHPHGVARPVACSPSRSNWTTASLKPCARIRAVYVYRTPACSGVSAATTSTISPRALRLHRFRSHLWPIESSRCRNSEAAASLSKNVALISVSQRLQRLRNLAACQKVDLTAARDSTNLCQFSMNHAI